MSLPRGRYTALLCCTSDVLGVESLSRCPRTREGRESRLYQSYGPENKSFIPHPEEISSPPWLPITWFDPEWPEHVVSVCDYDRDVPLFRSVNNVPSFVPPSPSSTNSDLESLPNVHSRNFPSLRLPCPFQDSVMNLRYVTKLGFCLELRSRPVSTYVSKRPSVNQFLSFKTDF